MNHQAQDTYLRMQVNTAAPWELTTLLFNGCIKFMKQAVVGIESHQYEVKNTFIKKSIDIIDELLITLNYDYDLSKQLASLYEYMKDKMHQANFKNDVNAIQECIELMTDLKNTWVQSMKEYHSKSKVES
jgi:flagellar biosynthetic protein FliS